MLLDLRKKCYTAKLLPRNMQLRFHDRNTAEVVHDPISHTHFVGLSLVLTIDRFAYYSISTHIVVNWRGGKGVAPNPRLKLA